MPALIAAGRLVLGYTASDAYWMDVGTPERYFQVHRDILSGRFRTDLSEAVRHGPLTGASCQVAPDAHCTAEVLLGSGCRVQALARVAGPSVIGDNALIGERAVIERSILWDGVEVGAGAMIRDSVLGSGCRVGAGAVVESALLASGARVQPGVHLPTGSHLEPDATAG
jgi:mannose-1-phosphate guanylyltransferase